MVEGAVCGRMPDCLFYALDPATIPAPILEPQHPLMARRGFCRCPTERLSRRAVSFMRRAVSLDPLKRLKPA